MAHADPKGPVIRKIMIADPDTYIIFFIRSCGYCQSALKCLRETGVKYKGYDINDIGMQELLAVLKENADQIGFDTSHHTKPIIFLNKRFIGGSSELRQLLKCS